MLCLNFFSFLTRYLFIKYTKINPDNPKIKKIETATLLFTKKITKKTRKANIISFKNFTNSEIKLTALEISCVKVLMIIEGLVFG